MEGFLLIDKGIKYSHHYIHILSSNESIFDITVLVQSSKKKYFLLINKDFNIKNKHIKILLFSAELSNTYLNVLYLIVTV